MATFRVRARVYRDVEFEIEAAADYTAAMAAAYAQCCTPAGFDADVRDIQQLSEPWARGGWQVAEVFIAKTSIGNRFRVGDRALLEQRLNDEGFGVVDSWNGTEGSDTASFRCTTRPGRHLTEAQRARIFAPRPETKT